MHPMRQKTPYRGKLVAVPQTPHAGDPQMCERFNRRGEWETVLAPWAVPGNRHAVNMESWFRENVGAVVYTSYSLHDPYRPLLEVYHIAGYEPTWAGSNLLGRFAGESLEGPNLHGTALMGLHTVRFYFLVDPVALGRLTREFNPLIFSPRQIGPRHRARTLKGRNHLNIEDMIDRARARR